MSERTHTTAPLKDQLEQAAGPDFIFIGESEFINLSDKPEIVYVLSVRDHYERTRQAHPYADILGQQEEAIVRRLVDMNVFKEEDVKKGRGTHVEDGKVVLGLFPFQRGEEKGRLLFAPTEAYGQRILDFLKASAPGNFTSESIGEMNGLLGEGVFPFANISQAAYNRLFVPNS